MGVMKLSNTILIGLIACCGCLSAAMAANVQGVRSYRAPDYTRLVFDLDAPPQYTLNTRDPVQVVVDLQDSTLATRLDNLNLENTPIASISSAALDAGGLRVVLALRAKVDPRSFALGKNEQYGDRLVLDLYDVDAAAATAAAPPTAITKATTSVTTPTQSQQDSPGDALAALTASLDADGKRDIVIAISAGHGGDDPGAIGVKRLQEKQVTLAISRELAAQLNKIEGYKAVLIRDGDYYVGLRQRIEQGHDANADLYLAIHADAADNKNATGATVYALSDRGATSEQARRLADKENNADLIGGVGSVSLTDKDAMLASVLLDLSMTASVATSLDIGNELINSLGAVTRLRRRNVEQAAFVELKSADIPSLLIESGYITNSDDARQLDSSAWRKQFAGALTNGITRWFHKRPPRGTLIAWNQQHGATTAAGPSNYTVRRGDSLSMVAQRFNVTMAELKDANNIKRDSIQVGQILKIPAVAAAKAAFKEHTIAHGETLSQIAISYAIPLDVIRATNELKSDTIRPGQVLKIPAS
jgi:N-acetylmuramoyl-L-alanine amidase